MDVVILGRVGYDLYSEEPHVPLPQVRRFSRYLGGSSANMAVGLSRLGAKVGLISCLGNDSLSEFLVGFLKKENIETAHIQVAPGYLPSLCLTEVSPPDSFPQVFYRHDAVDTMLDAYRALERAKLAGRTVVLDVDFRSMSWKSPDEAGLAIRLALPFVDVLIGNQLELKLAAGVDDLDKAIAKLRDAGIPMLVSKLGELGTRVLTPQETVYLPPYKVDVATTIGAGDGFASGFLYAKLKGHSLTDCLHYGNAAAAIVVSRLSCSEAMPLLAEVEAMIRSQKDQKPMSVTA